MAALYLKMYCAAIGVSIENLSNLNTKTNQPERV